MAAISARLLTPRSNVCPSRELISRSKLYRKKKKKNRNKIYEKQVASVIEDCERKSNDANGKLETFRTLRLLMYGYSVDLSFRLELYQKCYMCLKHRVTLRIDFHLVL